MPSPLPSRRMEPESQDTLIIAILMFGMFPIRGMLRGTPLGPPKQVFFSFTQQLLMSSGQLALMEGFFVCFFLFVNLVFIIGG